MFLSAFKSPAEVNSTPPTWIPENFNFKNFIYAFQTAPFGKYFVNSIIVTAAVVVLTMIVTILAAFAFSRLKFPGRDLLFSFCISLMMVPFEMIVITNYATISKLDLIDNLVGLIIPFTSSIFYTYILRNFFLSIPDSLYYSARVDGASNWHISGGYGSHQGQPCTPSLCSMHSLLECLPLALFNYQFVKNRTLPLVYMHL